AAWRVDPAAPAIIVGTVDMIGSRLLFEGYGVGRRMRPLQAGLLGCDCLVILDEAHLVPPFAALLRRIAADPALRGAAGWHPLRSLRLLTLSATGGDAAGERFGLDVEDRNDALVARRLDAIKSLRIGAAVERKDLPRRLAEIAQSRARDAERPARVIVFCNQRRQAQEVEKILAESGLEVHLLVGERRGHERAAAARALEEAGFLAGSSPAEGPAVLVATAAGEVGIDLDADHMVADVVAFERMVQRLGRLNRRGERALAMADLLPVEADGKGGEEDTRQARCLELLKKLPPLPGGGWLASPAALQRLQEDPALAALRKEASTPEPLYPALTLPLVEAWSLTGLAEHTGRPEIEPWLRGWVEEEAQVRLFWRRFLPWRSGEIPARREVDAFFLQAPPALPEILEAPRWHAAEVIKARAKALQKAGAAPDSPALLMLDAALELQAGLTLKEVAEIDPKSDRLSGGSFWAIAAALGGLSPQGLLDAASEGIGPEAPSAARGIGCTADGPEGMPGVAWRISRGAADAAEPPAEGLVEAHVFVLAYDAEGEPEEVIRVWKEEPAEAETALARRPQSLADHAAAVERAAADLAARLGLPEEQQRMLCLAARLHDAGKAAERWQRAFGAPPAGGPYAKTAAHRIDQALLDGYRHEFGSLAVALRDPDLAALPEDLRDLALHLIAAHHGRARPVLEGRGAELPPSAAEAIARDAALRFARLQRLWGPWGLAWWEALLRCADAAASAQWESG
ncbi:MAG: type I-U CRISPR-associated helicase/endonuclease Cas3, partial [Rhodovarius sp.]|nr:type I-U CRISPR-associated helicase/endonuclease Cas3 [Rhodovarius sp.]